MTNREAAEAMREAGWSVAVHNDYWLSGQPMTFWLWTQPNGHWIKGEGSTDEIALAECLRALPLPTDASAPAPAPTDERIAGDMVMAYMRTPASQSLLQRMFAVLAVAKPLIRQQMESRHD